MLTLEIMHTNKNFFIFGLNLAYLLTLEKCNLHENERKNVKELDQF